MSADPHAHTLCADAARAVAYWGASWTAVALCLSLLMDSIDFANLCRWAAIEMRIVDGLIQVIHRDVTITLAPLTDNGAAHQLDEEDVMEHVGHIRDAQVLDVVCDRKPATACRSS